MTLPWRDCTAYGSAVGDAVKGWRQAGPTLEPTAALPAFLPRRLAESVAGGGGYF